MKEGCSLRFSENETELLLYILTKVLSFGQKRFHNFPGLPASIKATVGSEKKLEMNTLSCF